MSVMTARRRAIRPSSSRWNQVKRTALPTPRAALLVRLLRGLDQVFADVGLELLPHRLHGLAPRGEVVLGERLDPRLARLSDALLVLLVQVVGEVVAIGGRLVHRLGEALAHVRRQP